MAIVSHDEMAIVSQLMIVQLMIVQLMIVQLMIMHGDHVLLAIAVMPLLHLGSLR